MKLSITTTLLTFISLSTASTIFPRSPNTLTPSHLLARSADRCKETNCGADFPPHSGANQPCAREFCGGCKIRNGEKNGKCAPEAGGCSKTSGRPIQCKFVGLEKLNEAEVKGEQVGKFVMRVAEGAYVAEEGFDYVVI